MSLGEDASEEEKKEEVWLIVVGQVVEEEERIHVGMRVLEKVQGWLVEEFQDELVEVEEEGLDGQLVFGDGYVKQQGVMVKQQLQIGSLI